VKEVEKKGLDVITRWFVKWIFLPAIGCVLIFLAMKIQTNEWKCRNIAKQKGYLESRYVPGNRGTGKACLCLKKQNLDGTVDVKAKLVIDLD